MTTPIPPVIVQEDLEKLRGDLHHLISPIIGSLRLAERHAEEGKELFRDIPHLVDRLYLALNLLDEAVVGQPAEVAQRGRHGVGQNHYPALVSPNSSPCYRPHPTAYPA